MELSIDTSTRYASVGLSEDGETVKETSWRSEQNHSVELVPAIHRLLETARVSTDRIQAVFVALGPGGFSALRVGLSTAKGIAAARQVPLVGVDTLTIEAGPYLDLGKPVWAMIDAGRSKLYAGLFDTGDSNCGGSAVRYRVIAHGELPSLLGRGAVVCGEAVTGPANETLRRLADHVCLIEAQPPTRGAATLARLAYRRLAAGDTDDPAAVEPMYMNAAQFEKAEKARVRRDGF